MLGMLCMSANHLDVYATDLVGQLVSHNVIGFVDIHGCVSVSVSATRIKDVGHINKIDSNVFCDGVFFQKR